jgi:hypothetical protein
MSNGDPVVYCIRNRTNDRAYVGATLRWPQRQYHHTSALNCGHHSCPALQADWNAYGASAFVFIILEVIPDATKSTLRAAEQKWIDALRANDAAGLYNTYLIIVPVPKAPKDSKPRNVVQTPRVPVAVSMPQGLRAEIDSYILENRIPSRAEAVQRLIELALNLKTKESK